MTGVDNSTYSLTGEAYSMIAQPKSASTAARVLQKDDVALGMLTRSNPSSRFPRACPGHPAHQLFPSFCPQPTNSARR
jgi:hypothetical protein